MFFFLSFFSLFFSEHKTTSITHSASVAMTVYELKVMNKWLVRVILVVFLVLRTRHGKNSQHYEYYHILDGDHWEIQTYCVVWSWHKSLADEHSEVFSSLTARSFPPELVESNTEKGEWILDLILLHGHKHNSESRLILHCVILYVHIRNKYAIST